MHSRTHSRRHSHRHPRSTADAAERTERPHRNLALVTGGFGAFFRHGHGHHGHGMHAHCAGAQPATGPAVGPSAPGAAALPGASSGRPSTSSS